MLLVNLCLVEKTDESQTSVNLSEVEHNILLVVLVGQLDDAGALFVKFGTILLVVAIDARHIYQYVDQL